MAYTAPVEEMAFLLRQVAGLDELLASGELDIQTSISPAEGAVPGMVKLLDEPGHLCEHCKEPVEVPDQSLLDLLLLYSE